MKNVFIIERGSCRGDEFTFKFKLEFERFKELYLKAYKDILKDEGVSEEVEEEINAFLEEQGYTGRYRSAFSMFQLVRGEYSEEDALERLEQLEREEGFVIETEESAIGVASSKRQATLNLAGYDDDNW